MVVPLSPTQGAADEVYFGKDHIHVKGPPFDKGDLRPSIPEPTEGPNVSARLHLVS
jgi:hypothetical protein